MNCILVRAACGRIGQCHKLAGISSAQHDAVTEQCCAEQVADAMHMLLPTLVAEPQQARLAEVVLVASALAIRQVRNLQRLHPPVIHDRRAESGAKSQEQHAAAGIAAQCLHRCIVDALHGLAECLLEVEGRPATTDIDRLAKWTVVLHRPRIPERDGLVVPVFRGFEDAARHVGRRHRGARRDALGGTIPRAGNLDVGTADIDDEDSHDGALRATATPRHDGRSSPGAAREN